MLVAIRLIKRKRRRARRPEISVRHAINAGVIRRQAILTWIVIERRGPIMKQITGESSLNVTKKGAKKRHPQ